MKSLALLSSLLLCTNVFAMASAKTYLTDQYMTKDEPWVAYCQNQIRIVNQTDQVRDYTVTHHLCADNHECVNAKWYPKLHPGEGWSKDFEAAIGLLYHREGTKSIWSRLTIDGESHDDSTKYATAYVRSK